MIIKKIKTLFRIFENLVVLKNKFDFIFFLNYFYLILILFEINLCKGNN